ncbi:MAG: phosphate acetyltransferase [Proteobacteria bacterium]|nr:MAG: phosphate acetyltransferase [Pseudomonadota bacterium]
MPHILLTIPVGYGVGLTSVSMGLVRALNRAGHRTGYVKPLGQPDNTAEEGDRSTLLIRRTTHLDPPDPLPSEEVERLLSSGEEERLLEEVVERVEAAGRDCDVLVIEGLFPSDKLVYSTRTNVRMAVATDAHVVLVGVPKAPDASGVAESFSILATFYNEGAERVSGCVLNRVSVPDVRPASRLLDVALRPVSPEDAQSYRDAIAGVGLRLIGLIPDEPVLALRRVSDVARELGAEVLSAGQMAQRRVARTAVGAMSTPNFLEHVRHGTLVITPGDRSDIFMACCLSELSGTRLAGVVLTGGIPMDSQVWGLCRAALDWGLPILATRGSTSETYQAVLAGSNHCPTDDRQRAERAMNHVAQHLDPDWLGAIELQGAQDGTRMSPPAFRHELIERARAGAKTIVLPEGDEPRTITAAATCEERGIAHCILLGEPDAIREVCDREHITLPDGVEIVRPAEIIDRYIEPMCEIRKGKGLTRERAEEQLQDTVVLGTMMLAQGHVDGLVSGAVHTTASTIRPALQLIKTAPGSSIVSSLFFMLLPDQVLVYGDCAVNPDPNAEQLAEIALQSAASAEAFGIPARVAMLSYSTGVSSGGSDVDKVREATLIVQRKRPDLVVDGPIQYDAAIIPSVARSKAPDSKLEGRATVFIFPDLDAGNMTYKAVQRAARVVSIGPMLQGLAKPVNDLSRGCLVEDVVYTIALTAIQAVAMEAKEDPPRDTEEQGRS